MLALVEGRELDQRLARLFATVLGQDLTEVGDGCFRIVRGSRRIG
jgi:hypothetical protein